MPSRKMRTAIYFFYGLDVEIRLKMDPPELFIHLGGAIGIRFLSCLSAWVGCYVLVRSIVSLGPSLAAELELPALAPCCCQAPQTS